MLYNGNKVGIDGPVAVSYTHLNMAMQAGGVNAQNLYEMGAAQQAQMQTQAAGARNPQPVSTGQWFCPQCGNKNSGKFCVECATPRPSMNRTYTCSNCGWQAVNPENPPKFCPECGDRFDQSEIR